VFHKVCIHTLSEGDVSELHIGLKGTMGALYLKDLIEGYGKSILNRQRWSDACSKRMPPGPVR
jgi:site-specific DNA recombinase